MEYIATTGVHFSTLLISLWVWNLTTKMKDNMESGGSNYIPAKPGIFFQENPLVHEHRHSPRKFEKKTHFFTLKSELYGECLCSGILWARFPPYQWFFSRSFQKLKFSIIQNCILRNIDDILFVRWILFLVNRTRVTFQERDYFVGNYLTSLENPQ